MQILIDLTAVAVALSIAFATWMWFLVWRKKFTVPVWDLAMIFSVAFTVQLLIYVAFSFILVDIQLRAYMVRTSIVVICLSQAVPLMITYRTWKHGQ